MSKKRSSTPPPDVSSEDEFSDSDVETVAEDPEYVLKATLDPITGKRRFFCPLELCTNTKGFSSKPHMFRHAKTHHNKLFVRGTWVDMALGEQEKMLAGIAARKRLCRAKAKGRISRGRCIQGKQGNLSEFPSYDVFFNRGCGSCH